MNTENYSLDEFKNKVDEIELDYEKVEFISGSILKWKYAIQKVKAEVESLATSEFIINFKSNNPNNELTKFLNNDKKVKRSITREVIKLCAENICKKYKCLISLAETYLTYYKTLLETKTRLNNNTECSEAIAKDVSERIVWRSSKEKLIELFDCLYENEIIPKYSKEEILSHFSNEKNIPFSTATYQKEQFCWNDSDCRFSIFVDELAKRGIIDDENKFKIFTIHFVNKRNKPFKGLAQKRSYTDNYTKTGNLIREILNSVGLTT